MATVDCFAVYTLWKREKQLRDDLWTILDFALSKMHSEIIRELNPFLFPEGREKAFQDLEDMIHRMGFQDED